ncbi:hypothetical protein AA0111_g11632 [Alternaria arborescens]|uniref:hypothetical protein n=1 Tax=Alternaria arborescens TaxID=156630 RepID=UPI00107539C9|nr:hypothetical protein AA0111_g11632 [Alternaria arborescens]RYO15711.1 hypothetical protein AA0111_g11632 [Alternaria arborescens]
MEGGFSKALLLRREDGTEIVAKMPFAIAGPPKYTTASEVAVLQYLPKVLAWDTDPSNPVGVEYIIMEKAPGVQLYKVWGDMNDWQQLRVVTQFTEFEGQMAKIRLPANGSLYLTKSMAESDTYVALDREMDPSGDYCIGPSCERGWHAPDHTATLYPQLHQGPWPDLPSFGTALVERELTFLQKRWSVSTTGVPRGSLDEEITVLKMAKEVMSRLNERTLMGKVSEPVLWHTDLHMGNIYVSEQNPEEIVSLIDWQSVVVSPLFLQARFPEFLTVGEDYVLGTMELPKLPPNFDEMDAEDKKFAEHNLKEAKLAKIYEISSKSKNIRGWKALQVPLFIRELFIRCAEASEEGVVPLRACLIEYAANWEEIGFEGECPISFSEEELKRHEQQFEEYSKYHEILKWARGILGTDVEGWLMPMLDIEEARKKSDELLEEFVRRCDQYNMTPERMREIWPYSERS